jgi:hypothetical protein
MTFLHGSSLISDGQQLVNVASTHSTSTPGTYGVPLRFILGPLLCLVYVNDMSTLSNKLLVSGKINLKKSLLWHESYKIG